MTVADIIKKVRWCIDEESGYTDYEDVYLNNIIKSCIGVSLRWCAFYADAMLLTDGSGTTDTSLATDYSLTIGEQASSPEGVTYSNGRLILPATALRVTRARVNTWHKASCAFIMEDSDEYLMQYDDTAKATIDRPVACVIQTNPLKVELFPHPENGDTVEISIVNSPDDTAYMDAGSESTDVNIPVKMRGAFFYYLAYLVLCAHNDTSKASLMLNIAKQQIAIKAE